MVPIKNYKNILIFNPAFLGDTIITTPLMKALRHIFPEANIAFCVRPEHIDLFEDVDFINEVITFDKRNSQKGFSGLINFSNILSSHRFDLIINLHLSLRSTALLSFKQKTDVIGFSSAVMSSLFTKRVEKKHEYCEVERYLFTLSAICKDFTIENAKKIGGSLECFIDTNLYNNTKTYFNTVAPNKKVIGIAPGSVWPTKRYPIESFVKIAEELYSKGYEIALFGGKDDKDSLQAFASSFSKPYFDFAEKTSLKELPAILKAIDTLIVNDSGAMHIAVATNTPVIAIFGPTVKSLGFFPYDDKSIVIENNNLRCRPCSKHGGKTCPKKHFKCMIDIDYNTIVDATIKILNG